MRKVYELRIRDLYDVGFTISELAIMYTVSEYRIKLVLEAKL